MPAGASPNIRPVRSVPGKAAPRVGHPPLHFLLAACGVGGTRGRLVSVPSFLSSATAPGTIFTCGSSSARSSFVTGRGGSSNLSLAVGHRPLSRSVSPFPFWRGAGRLLTLLPGQQRVENVGCIGIGSSSNSSSSSSSSSGISWLYRSVFGSIMAAEGSSDLSTSGSSDHTSNGGGGGGGGGVDGEGTSSASLEMGPRSAASGEGATKRGGAGGGDFPIVTLDADAVQKFAEIEVRWGGDKSSEPTILVRGLKSAEYHVEAAEPTMVRLREAGDEATITGGGRIKHSSKHRSIFIYGYSMQFGPANLPRVADLCREQFGPDYEVTWTEGGY